MLPQVSKVRKFRPRFILVSVFVANFTLILCTPAGMAQGSQAESPNGEISGTVLLNVRNSPATQVAVSLRSRGAGVFRSILTDFAGRFAARDLPAGVYDVVVEEAGYDPVTTRVELGGTPMHLVMHLKSNVPTNISRVSPTVSVRELKIPEKARKEYQLGLRCLKKDDLPGSVKHFSKATSAFEGYYEAHYHAGLAELRLGHRDAAMRSFQLAVELSDGKYAPAEFGVGVILSEAGKLHEAEMILRRGIEANDSLPMGHVLLGMVMLQEKRTEDAEKSGREALLHDPKFAPAYLLLADVGARRGDYYEQVQDLERYLKLQPAGPERSRALQAHEAALHNLAEARLQNETAASKAQ